MKLIAQIRNESVKIAGNGQRIPRIEKLLIEMKSGERIDIGSIVRTADLKVSGRTDLKVALIAADLFVDAVELVDEAVG